MESDNVDTSSVLSFIAAVKKLEGSALTQVNMIMSSMATPPPLMRVSKLNPTNKGLQVLANTVLCNIMRGPLFNVTYIGQELQRIADLLADALRADPQADTQARLELVAHLTKADVTVDFVVPAIVEALSLKVLHDELPPPLIAALRNIREQQHAQSCIVQSVKQVTGKDCSEELRTLLAKKDDGEFCVVGRFGLFPSVGCGLLTTLSMKRNAVHAKERKRQTLSPMSSIAGIHLCLLVHSHLSLCVFDCLS